MCERHEYLAMPPAMFAHVIFDDRVAASKPVLVPQALEDAFRRVPLLSRPVPVVGKPLVDNPGEPVQLRALDRRRPPISQGTEKRIILSTLSREIPKRRAIARLLIPRRK
jgi:hypothetical protein